MRFLLVHQSSELYGSDRSFLSVVEGVRENNPDAEINIILPDVSGPLVPLLKNNNVTIEVDPNGYLRKVFLKNPIALIYKLALSYFEYRKRSKIYDVLYINTVVCVSALLSSRAFLRSWVHVRELPTGYSAAVFRWLLIISGAGRVFNSKATKKAFNLSGVVVYNGISKLNQDLLTEPGDFSSGMKRFLLIGRISEWKGQSFVVDALKNFSTPIELVILGGVAPGRELFAEELREAAAKIKWHKIRFVDFSNDPSAYYLWANFVIVPSLLPEPFGRVAIEAMAYGRPPIVADHGGLSEIITDDNSGFRFEPGNHNSLLDVLGNCVSMSTSDYTIRSNGCISIFRSMYTEAVYKKRVCELLN